MKRKIYKNVTIGEGSIIEDFCEIGCPSRGKKDGEVPTMIGENSVIRSGTVIYAGTFIGKNFQCGHNVLIREENKIGDNVSIGTNSAIEVGNKIGDNTRIHSLCFLEKVELEDNVFVGPGVVFLDDPHPDIPVNHDCLKGALVKKNARIGGASTILPHRIIGEGALIGAGTVVSKNVETQMVVIGNPSRNLKKLEDVVCKRSKIPHNPYRI